MLYRILKSRIKQFGGGRLVREYARMGILWPMAKVVLRNPFSRESYKRAYLVALSKIEPYLADKYGPMIQERKAFYSTESFEHHKRKIIWFCWLQGLENAPQIVKVCYASMYKHFPEREIKLIDDSNWCKYVKMPDYILEKWQKRKIPPANFSDLLRLELLIRYGGTWVDATVLCTGSNQTKDYFDADLFMFQYRSPGSDQWRGIGNWFITACTNNEVLMVLRDMLFAYWKDYDCTLDYYIFHLFFTMLSEIYPEDIAKMPYGYAIRHIALAKHWGEMFEQEKWDRLVNQVSLHKLTYIVSKSVKKDKKNYYNHIVRDN